MQAAGVQATLAVEAHQPATMRVDRRAAMANRHDPPPLTRFKATLNKSS